MKQFNKLVLELWCGPLIKYLLSDDLNFSTDLIFIGFVWTMF